MRDNKCKQCGLNDKYKNRLICRQCITDKQREERASNPNGRIGEGASYYRKNRETVLLKHKERNRNNPEQYLWYTAKKRAAKKGIEFSISIEDVVIPTHCPVLGIELFQGDGKISSHSPSIDRVNPSKGYISGNVRVISHKLNAMKSDMTIDIARKLLSYMEEHQ